MLGQRLSSFAVLEVGVGKTARLAMKEVKGRGYKPYPPSYAREITFRKNAMILSTTKQLLRGSFPFAPLLLLAAMVFFSTTATPLYADEAPAASEEDEGETPEGETSTESEEEDADEEPKDLQGRINKKAEYVVNKILAPRLFYGIPTGLKSKGKEVTIPLIVLVLVVGGVVFTFLYGFINIRLFRHSIAVIRGKFDHPDDEGEITHFQALTSALSATVGLGNIAMVAVAIQTGGAGAVFWMWVIAFFGMSLKFSSCSFAQTFRKVKPDGTVLGGPMVYLSEGMKKHIPALAPLGWVFGAVFAIFTMMAAFGGGNMFQGNQSFSIFSTIVAEKLQVSEESIKGYAWLFGLILAGLVGIVIIGGIKRIGEVTSKLVPTMCAFYCLCCLVIIGSNLSKVPGVFGKIFSEALTPEAGFGALVVVLFIGAKRAAFSNEAGLGSAAIAHAAAKTKEPIREGVVAMIGPFIDTHIVCTMTAVTILVTGVEQMEGEGIELTTAAFASLGTWVPYLLCIAVFVFAYSTMISWCYYGERATEYLFGEKAVLPYRVVYVLFVILGPILSLKAVTDFSDMMLLSMAFPNIIGMLILYRFMRPKVNDYVARLRSGEMKPVK